MLKRSLLDQRGRSPEEKKTGASRDKEVLGALQNQLPQMIWDDPKTQETLVPKALDITRRGGKYRVTNKPQMVDPSFPWSLFSGEKTATGETDWDIEEISPEGQMDLGSGSAEQDNTMTFKTQQEFIDFLLTKQRQQDVH